MTSRRSRQKQVIYLEKENHNQRLAIVQAPTAACQFKVLADTRSRTEREPMEVIVSLPGKFTYRVRRDQKISKDHLVVIELTKVGESGNFGEIQCTLGTDTLNPIISVFDEDETISPWFYKFITGKISKQLDDPIDRTIGSRRGGMTRVLSGGSVVGSHVTDDDVAAEDRLLARFSGGRAEGGGSRSPEQLLVVSRPPEASSRAPAVYETGAPVSLDNSQARCGHEIEVDIAKI